MEVQVGLRSVSVNTEPNRSVFGIGPVSESDLSTEHIGFGIEPVSVIAVSVSVLRYTEPNYRIYICTLQHYLYDNEVILVFIINLFDKIILK
jgi:hypothetical protein